MRALDTGILEISSRKSRFETSCIGEVGFVAPRQNKPASERAA
jgi:hypothetical protein